MGCIGQTSQGNRMLFFPAAGKSFSCTAVSGTYTVVALERSSQLQTHASGGISATRRGKEIGGTNAPCEKLVGRCLPCGNVRRSAPGS